MNISKNRPTDEQIIAALKADKSQSTIIAELGTHSQRIMQIKRTYGFIAETKSLGYRYGSTVKYVEDSTAIETNNHSESFLMNMF